ncbi:MAG: hypothetical protein AB7S41_13590 [Parvibaculaceae bacterium]
MVKLIILTLLMGLSLAFSKAAPAQGLQPTLETVVELPPETPYEQEMLLLRIRGVNHAPITVQSLGQPDLRNFAWMQLGRDKWFETMLNGRKVLRFERAIAVFPQRAGRLQIGSFVHRQTVLDAKGARQQIEVVSAPVKVEVRPKPENAGWWLPARSLKVTDTWDKPPDRLGLGEVARRTVTLEAEGIGPELFPPIPSLRSPGVVAFFDPEERSTILTPDGPVSKVTWRWSVKGATSSPATIKEVHIPWFDTTTRAVREAVLAPQEVRLASTATDAREPLGFWTVSLPAIGVAGFAMGLALAMRRRRFRSWRELASALGRLIPDRLAVALRRAARSGDVRSAWLAAHRLVRRVDLGPRSEAFDGLRILDEAVFGRPASRPSPSLSRALEILSRQPLLSKARAPE